MMAGLNDFADDSKLSLPRLGDSFGNTSNKELMAEARESLSGNWGKAIVGYVLYYLLIGSFAIFLLSACVFGSASLSSAQAEFVSRLNVVNPVMQLIEILVSGAVIVGFRGFFLGIAQESEARMELFFIGFRRFWKSFAVYFLYSLFIMLWTLLLVIPGIIATFRYAMAFYIVADDEDCGPLEAIRRSKEMMKGNKWKYFCLHWRFFWWGLLCMIVPFGYLWLLPYIQTSRAQFYEDVS